MALLLYAGVISLGTGRISPVYYVYLVYRDLRYLGGTIFAEYNYKCSIWEATNLNSCNRRVYAAGRGAAA